MSAIRNLDATPFDELAGVLVDEEFQVIRAALVPVAVVRDKSVHVAHTSSWKFLLRDDVWNMVDVWKFPVRRSAADQYPVRPK